MRRTLVYGDGVVESQLAPIHHPERKENFRALRRQRLCPGEMLQGTRVIEATEVAVSQRQMGLHQIRLERQCLFGIDPFLIRRDIGRRRAVPSPQRLSKRQLSVGERKARVLGDGLPI